jgi:hypothetical protein
MLRAGKILKIVATEIAGVASFILVIALAVAPAVVWGMVS